MTVKAFATGALALTLCMIPTAAQARPSVPPANGDARSTTVRASSFTGALTAPHTSFRTSQVSVLAARRLTHDLNTSPRRAICWVFGDDCTDAIAVARCESTLQTSARNGQYLGLFQMGSWERALFGHGSTPLQQATAAHRYFVRSGSDWSPWTCKPWW